MNDLFSTEKETALRQTTVIASTDFNVLSLFDYYHTKNWVFKI